MKVLLIDTGGMHASTAKALADQGNEVFYYIPYFSPYARFKDFASGLGLPGVTKVLDFGNYLDEVDLILFPDVGMGDFAQYLRDKGYPVFGAGKAEEMEQDRGLSSQMMDQFGIAHPEMTVVKGIDEALQFLFKKQETNQLADGNYFVKFNVFRGSIDSFPADTLEQTEEMFAKVRSEFGPYANEIPIIINKKSEGTETGADLFFNGTDFIKPVLWGFESSSNYVGYVDSDIPDFQKDYLEKSAEYLRSVNYRGAFSTEVIYNGQECSFIDWTCRFPMPLGLMYSHFIPNFAEFLLAIAQGETPKTGLPEGKYIGIASFSSENAIEDWLPVKGNEFSQFLRFIQVNGHDFIVPGVSTLGCVVGTGDSFDSFNKDLIKNCEGVEAFFGSLDPDFLREVTDKYLDPLKKYGIQFGPNPKLENLMPKSRAQKFLEICRRQA